MSGKRFGERSNFSYGLAYAQEGTYISFMSGVRFINIVITYGRGESYWSP